MLAAVGATATIVYFVLCFIQGLTGGWEFYWDRHSAREMKKAGTRIRIGVCMDQRAVYNRIDGSVL